MRKSHVSHCHQKIAHKIKVSYEERRVIVWFTVLYLISGHHTKYTVLGKFHLFHPLLRKQTLEWSLKGRVFKKNDSTKSSCLELLCCSCINLESLALVSFELLWTACSMVNDHGESITIHNPHSSQDKNLCIARKNTQKYKKVHHLQITLH